MTDVIKKPSPPSDDDCCGGGACNPCVWDHYYEQRKIWRLAQVTLKEQEQVSQTTERSIEK